MMNQFTREDFNNTELENKYAGYNNVIENFFKGDSVILSFNTHNDICKFLSQKKFIRTEIIDTDLVKFAIQ
jgi:hypothetical protein